jgi:hypothetical protein
MDPITIGLILGGSQLVSGLIGAGVQSYFTNKQAQSDEDRSRIIEELQTRAYENLQMPSGQATPLTFEEYSVLAQYKPEIARMVAETAPQLIGEAQSQDVIQVQKDTLQQYQQLSKSGVDAQGEADRSRLLSDVQGKSNTARANLLREYSQRGLGGSGQDVLANLAAEGQIQDRAQQQGLDIAAQNQGRRLDALKNASNLAGQMRQTNLGVEQTNTNTMNEFNRRNTMNLQNYEIQRANALNQAQQLNQNRAQSVADNNIAGRTQINNQNLIRTEQAAETLRRAQNDRTLGKAGVQVAGQERGGQIEANRTAGKLAAINTVLGGATRGATSAASGFATSQTAKPGATKTIRNADGTSFDEEDLLF